MILRGPFAILHVDAQGARANRAQPFCMIEKGKILFDLDVTEVVPVAGVRRIQLIEQDRQFSFARNFFVTTPAFQSQLHTLTRGIFQDRLERIFDAFQIWRRDRLAFLDRIDLFPNEFAREQFSFFDERDQFVRNRSDRHFTEMHHDERRA